MGMKRSLEITIKHFNAGDRAAVVGALEDAGLEVVYALHRTIQVRKTTPTEIRRLCRGISIHSIKEGFSR
jgi:hypothetical protein